MERPPRGGGFGGGRGGGFGGGRGRGGGGGGGDRQCYKCQGKVTRESMEKFGAAEELLHSDLRSAFLITGPQII